MVVDRPYLDHGIRLRSLLLHKLKQDITENNIKTVIKATGVAPDEVRVKALVAALSEVNIEDALKAAPVSAVSSNRTTKLSCFVSII